MGEVIRKSAAVEDILTDVRQSSLGAQARGGVFKTAADQALKPALTLFESVETKWHALEASLAPLIAAHDHRDDQADALIGRTADSVWNDVGRPAPGSDAIFDMMFPAGITFYTDGPDDEQPERMALLADLLESGLHPRLDPAAAKDYAKKLRDCAAELDGGLDALRKPRVRLAMYGRMRTAAAKNAQAALGRFKRILRANDLSEADIHTVIPDRPSAPKKPTPANDPSDPSEA